MPTSEYTVTGMTCENCEKHIREEVGHLAGVTDIVISRAEGTLQVTTAVAPVDDTAVLAAVAEAGYAAVRRP